MFRLTLYAAFTMYGHLCVVDVNSGHHNAVIIIKWSTSIQNRAKTATISLPA